MTGYEQILTFATPRPIRDTAEYERSLAVVEQLMRRYRANPSRDLGDALDLVAGLIERYEVEHMALSHEQRERHRFTVDEVLRMAERETLPAGVQLIEGDLIEMPPMKPEHAGPADSLKDVLRAAYPAEFRVRTAMPLILPHDSTTLPEPDLAVVRGTARSFYTRHPRGDEALLVVEVANTSRPRDLAKVARYAAAGVPEYWVVDVVNQKLHRYAEPTEGQYGLHASLDATGVIGIPGTSHSLQLSDLF